MTSLWKQKLPCACIAVLAGDREASYLHVQPSTTVKEQFEHEKGHVWELPYTKENQC